jgi:hypothetical protein
VVVVYVNLVEPYRYVSQVGAANGEGGLLSIEHDVKMRARLVRSNSYRRNGLVIDCWRSRISSASRGRVNS